MKLMLVSIERQGYVRVATDGNITAGDFALSAGRNPFENILGANWAGQRVLLSMENTTYIDSSAIGWLISCQKAFKAAGGAIVIHSIRPGVKQMLELLKISRIVPVADNENAGKAMLLSEDAALAVPAAAAVANGGVR